VVLLRLTRRARARWSSPLALALALSVGLLALPGALPVVLTSPARADGPAPASPEVSSSVCPLTLPSAAEPAGVAGATMDPRAREVFAARGPVSVKSPEDHTEGGEFSMKDEPSRLGFAQSSPHFGCCYFKSGEFEVCELFDLASGRMRRIGGEPEEGDTSELDPGEALDADPVAREIPPVGGDPGWPFQDLRVSWRAFFEESDVASEKTVLEAELLHPGSGASAPLLRASLPGLVSSELQGVFASPDARLLAVVRHTFEGEYINHGWWYNAWRSVGQSWYGTTFNIDLDGTLYQCLEMETRTNHVGGAPHFSGYANRTSIGVEICRFGKIRQEANPNRYRIDGYLPPIRFEPGEPADGICNYAQGSPHNTGTRRFDLRKMPGGTTLRHVTRNWYYLKIHDFNDERNPARNANPAIPLDVLFTEEQYGTLILWAKGMCEMHRVTILNDQDWFGAGEIRLTARINGEMIAFFGDRSIDSGATVALGRGRGWSKDLTVDPNGNERLTIWVRGEDEDLIANDSLGVVDARFDRTSTPAWGVGRHTLTSTNGSFRIEFAITRL